MKKLIGIILVVTAMLFTATAVSFAKTSDIVNQSGSGTAVLDGVKDEAYDTATPLEFVQKGINNGNGEVLDEAIGKAWVINDDTNVYVFFSIIDSALDLTSANDYERDSIDVFWMNDNKKEQWRIFCDDTGSNDSSSADYGTDPTDHFKVVTTDAGYDVECWFPITDVKANQIEMCLQINACSEGKRDYTCYIAGNQAADNAYQRSNRQSDYDCWWTLTLSGEHEDTRVEPEDKPMELDAGTYTLLKQQKLSASIHCQNDVTWNDWAVWTTETYYAGIGETISIDWTTFNKSVFDESNTNNYTVAPQFSIDINDSTGFLKIDPGAKEGDKGDHAKFSYTYSDITLSAEGYDDVVIPGSDIVSTWEIYVPSWGGTAGAGGSINLATLVRENTGWNVEELVKFMDALTEIKFDLTFNSINLVDIAALDEYAVQLEAEDEAKLAELKDAQDRVEAAKAVMADETATLDAKKDAAKDARLAANGAMKKAGDYPKALEAAEQLDKDAKEMEKTVEELEAAAKKAEEEAKAAEEAAKKKAEEEAAAAAAKKKQMTTIIIIVAVVVVVIAVIAVVGVILGKKKKAK